MPIVKETSNVLLTTNDKHATYPLVIIDIESIKFCDLIDTGTGTSLTSSSLIESGYRLYWKPASNYKIHCRIVL